MTCGVVRLLDRLVAQRGLIVEPQRDQHYSLHCKSDVLKDGSRAQAVVIVMPAESNSNASH